MLQPRYEITVAEAVSDLSEMPSEELVVYVEDEVARTLVQEALPAQERTRVRIVTCGSWMDVIRFLATFQRDPALGHAVGVLDGEREGKIAEHESAFKRHLGGTIDDDKKQWLGDRLCVLPGGAPPERWLERLGREETGFRVALASETRAEIGVVNDFFAAPPSSARHDLAYRLSRRIGTDEQRALVALAAAAIRSREADFRPLVDFVKSRLDAAG